MKDFIRPKREKNEPDLEKVDLFIDIFNNSIKQNHFSLNTGLSKIPRLSQSEFELAKSQAMNNGYILTQSDDNYNTKTYKLTDNR